MLVYKRFRTAQSSSRSQEIHVHVDTNMSWITNVIWNNNKMVSEHEIFYVINIMLLKSETFLAFPLENTKKKNSQSNLYSSSNIPSPSSFFMILESKEMNTKAFNNYKYNLKKRCN